MLIVTNLEGNSYAASSNIPRIRRVNGEREITLSFLRNEINDEFLSDIETGWTVTFKGDIYHLFNEQEDRHGNKQFDAVLDFFQHFNGKWHVDEVDDQSMTVNDSIRPLFDDSPYVLSIIDNFYANTMNYSRQQNSTERFLYFIGRHNAEFNIPIGTKTVQLRNRIGVKRNDIFIHEDDNLIDLNISTDTSSFCTAIRGYYRFRVPEGGGDESSEKEPTREYEYISPMAAKYGVIWGEPIWDERYDTEDGIKEACRLKQESTWKVSFDLDAELFENPLNEGDEIRFVMPSKKINNYIRVVEINEEFDADGDLISASYTFGNENIANQYRNMQYDAIKDISDIMAGRKPIPFSVLPRAVREATDVINAGDSTQFYYRADGIYGYNTSDPMGVTRYNANGLGLSRDGGQTFENAITYLGIVATHITSGTIDTNNVTIYGSEGYNRIEITGDKLKVWDSRYPDQYTEMTRNEFHAHKARFKITAFDGRVVMDDGLMRGSRVANIILFNQSLEHNNMNWVWNGGGWNTLYFIDDQYRGRFMDLTLVLTSPGYSAQPSIQLAVRLKTLNDVVVAESRWLVRRGIGEGSVENLRADLQQLYNSVPDYRRVALYVEANITINTNGHAAMRVNKGEFND